jgi:3-dehydroquinate synthase
LKSIPVRFKKPRNSGYEVLVHPGLLSKAGSEIKRRFPKHAPFIISSPRVHGFWGRALRQSLSKAGYKDVGLHLVPDGEKNKGFRQYELGLRALAAFGKGLRRKPLVVLLGGGVIGDLGGFVASTYKRGLPFIQIPTTLLSMVDSSVGGKLGIDFQAPGGLIKNLVGAFYQPSLVLADPLVLRSLAPREFSAGMAEAVKTALLFDAALFEAMESSASRLLAQDPRALSHVIASCVAHKARVVMRDEYDLSGARALLNLGHTFGHAVEAALDFKWLHGECVAFGICCAVDLSAALGLAAPELMRTEALLLRFGLPTRIRGLPLSRVMRAMAEDKKFDGRMNFVLPLRLGKSVLRPVASLEMVRRVLRARSGA